MNYDNSLMMVMSINFCGQRYEALRQKYFYNENRKEWETKGEAETDWER